MQSGAEGVKKACATCYFSFFDDAENKKKDIPQDVLPYLLDNIETIQAFLLAEKKKKPTLLVERVDFVI